MIIENYDTLGYALRKLHEGESYDANYVIKGTKFEVSFRGTDANGKYPNTLDFEYKAVANIEVSVTYKRFFRKGVCYSISMVSKSFPKETMFGDAMRDILTDIETKLATLPNTNFEVSNLPYFNAFGWLSEFILTRKKDEVKACFEEIWSA